MKKPQIECLESPSMPLSSHNRSGAILATFLAALAFVSNVYAADALDIALFDRKIRLYCKL